MDDSPAPDEPIVSGEPLVPTAAQAIKSNIHITVTQGAATKITMEEAEMLIKFVWPEIVKAGDHNAFTVPKLGLSIVRDGDELYIMTVEEKEAALRGQPVAPAVGGETVHASEELIPEKKEKAASRKKKLKKEK